MGKYSQVVFILTVFENIDKLLVRFNVSITLLDFYHLALRLICFTTIMIRYIEREVLAIHTLSSKVIRVRSLVHVYGKTFVRRCQLLK